MAAGLSQPTRVTNTPKAVSPKSWYVPIPLDGDDGAQALVALGVTGLIMSRDASIQDWVRDNRDDTSRRVSDLVEPFGTDTYIGPLVGGAYVAGVVFKDERLRQSAVRAVESAMLSQVFTEAVKHSTQRLRLCIADAFAG